MRQSRLAIFLLAPAILMVAATTIYPMLSSLWTSLHLFNLSRSLELGRFVGVENYTEAFLYDPEFWPVMRVTAVFVVLNVTVTILCALGLAILLRRAGVGQSILRTLIILPFAMTPALIGISWRFMLNPDFGPVNRAIGAILPFADQVNYLATPGLAMAALISADVWHWAPYFAFMLMGGLGAIPPETQEAARIDGERAAGLLRRDAASDRSRSRRRDRAQKRLRAEGVRHDRDDDGRRPRRFDDDARLPRLSSRLPILRLRHGVGGPYMLTAILFLLSLAYVRFLFRKRPA